MTSIRGCSRSMTLEDLVGRVGAVLDATHLVRDAGLGEVGVEPVEVRALGAVRVDELVVARHVETSTDSSCASASAIAAARAASPCGVGM